MINVPHKHIFPVTKSGFWGGGGRLDSSEILTSQKKRMKRKIHSRQSLKPLLSLGGGGFDIITLRSLILNLKVATQVRGASVRQEAYPW